MRNECSHNPSDLYKNPSFLKKGVAVLGIATAALSLSACGGETAGAESPVATSTSIATETPTSPTTGSIETTPGSTSSAPSPEASPEAMTKEEVLEVLALGPNGTPWEGINELTELVPMYDKFEGAGGLGNDGDMYGVVMKFVEANNPGWKPYPLDADSLMEIQSSNDMDSTKRIATDNMIVETTMQRFGISAEPGSTEEQAYEVWRRLHYTNYDENPDGYMTDYFANLAHKDLSSDDPAEVIEGVSWYNSFASDSQQVIDCTLLTGGNNHRYHKMSCVKQDPFYNTSMAEYLDMTDYTDASFWVQEIEVNRDTGAMKLAREVGLGNQMVEDGYSLSQFPAVQKLVGKPINVK